MVVSRKKAQQARKKRKAHICILAALLCLLSLGHAGANQEVSQVEQTTMKKWAQSLTSLQDRGITFSSKLILDQSQPVLGGVRKRWTSRSLFDLHLKLDLDPLVGLPGGTLFANYQVRIGRDASRDVGDSQAFSNIDANDRHQLAEFWYEQWLFEERLRFKIGRVDANSEFAFVENGAEFIHSSMGVSPTIFVLPTYPDPASSLNLFLRPHDQFSLSLGVYDGAGQRGVHTGVRGPQTLALGDLFFIGEVGGGWATGQQRLPSRLGLGGWRHTGTFARFSGGSQSGATGAYLVFDQMVWRERARSEDSSQGIAAFFQYGYADAAVSEITHHIGAGMIWTGLFPQHDEETFGVGASWARFSNAAEFDGAYELAIELFYTIQLTPRVLLKPDLQYILNPSGGQGGKDALVWTIRLEVSL